MAMGSRAALHARPNVGAAELLCRQRSCCAVGIYISYQTFYTRPNVGYKRLPTAQTPRVLSAALPPAQPVCRNWLSYYLTFNARQEPIFLSGGRATLPWVDISYQTFYTRPNVGYKRLPTAQTPRVLPSMAMGGLKLKKADPLRVGLLIYSVLMIRSWPSSICTIFKNSLSGKPTTLL